MNLPNRSKYFNKYQDKNFTNDTICVLNDKLKLNYILIPKCGSSTIRGHLFKKYREKLFSKLNNDEHKYIKFTFVRDVSKRFYSAVNTIVKRNNNKNINFIKSFNNNLLDYIINNNDEHLVSMYTYIKNININHIFDLDTLNQICNIKINKSVYSNKYNNIKKILEERDITNNIIFKKYYKNDYKLFNDSIRDVNILKDLLKK